MCSAACSKEFRLQSETLEQARLQQGAAKLSRTQWSTANEIAGEDDKLQACLFGEIGPAAEIDPAAEIGPAAGSY